MICEPVAVVDLVTVVGRRVVARGHHHARDRAEVAHRVRGDGRRPVTSREPHWDAGCGEHTRRLPRERARPAPVVEAHDDWAVGVMIAEVARQAGGRRAHDRDVHAAGPRAERPAQPGGPEFEPAREARGQRADVLRVDERLHLLACRRIRVGGDPGPRPARQVRRDGHGVDPCPYVRDERAPRASSRGARRGA